MLRDYEWVGALERGPAVVRRQSDGKCGVVWYDPDRDRVGALYPGGSSPGGPFRQWGAVTDETFAREVRVWEDEPRAVRHAAAVRSDLDLMRAAEVETWQRQPAGRVVRDPRVYGGRPIVAGTRVRVEDVLESLFSGRSVAQVLQAFPELVEEDVRAVMAWGLAQAATSDASVAGT